MRLEVSIGLNAGSTTLLIAYLKARVVLLNFMKLHQVPCIWRAMLEGRLSLFLLCAYWLSVFTA
ncbi:hypothetical protein [Pseudomonas fluorescens]|uniref:hypothetical protein n=1 Tax=Pseudomonas fluorescens TaxID=294 RepID=UPI0012416D66|nr:hypothetical protein [Pseudomonas fluorescens]